MMVGATEALVEALVGAEALVVIPVMVEPVAVVVMRVLAALAAAGAAVQVGS